MGGLQTQRREVYQVLTSQASGAVQAMTLKRATAEVLQAAVVIAQVVEAGADTGQRRR